MNAVLAIRNIKLAEAHLRLCLYSLMLVLFAGCNESAKLNDNNADAPESQSEIVGDERRAKLQDLLSAGVDPVVNSGEGLPNFRNVAADAAVNLQFMRFSDAVPGRYFLPEVMGGGVGWIDIDCDGMLDLYAINGCALWEAMSPSAGDTDRMYRNTLDGFIDVTLMSGTSDAYYGQGCAVGDFNSDGFHDLYITNYGRNTLLCANGDGTFSDETTMAEVGCEAWSSSAVWLDANLDGFADLYTVNYVNTTRENHKSCDYVGIEGYCGPAAWDAVDDVLYLNLGNGKFVKAESIAAEIELANGKGLAVAATDFDGDAIAEIYVANDMMPNFLLKRVETQGSTEAPLYKEIANSSGCAVSFDGRNEASMGVACSDFDGDGLVDIFLTHFYESKNTLYRNLGSMLFEDASRKSRIAATSFDKLGFGTVAFDANLDGSEDIFIANGHVLGPNLEPNEMAPQLLLNDGKGVFSDVSASIGGYFADRYLGRGVAGGDFDNDGRLDLAVSHLDVPLALLHNETPLKNHFIGLELLTRDRCYPAGGRVIITSAGRQRIVPVVAGGSYLSSNDLRLLIGLGTNDGPVDVEVQWSQQHSMHYQNLQIDRYWVLPESRGAVLRTGNPESN